MYLQNFVLSCIKKMKNYNNRAEESVPELTDRRRHSSPARPADQEMVRESLERGLPVIPFAQQNFLPDKVEEKETEANLKRVRRKSNDLKRDLSDFRFWNKQVYFEEDEEDSRNKDVSRQSSSLNMVDNFKRRLSSSSFSSSSYLEMRPRVREESYMKMDEFLVASENNGSDGLSSSLTSIWRETKKKEETCPGSLSLSKLFKKGNRHKNDYVYVDFEKDNYVDMSNHKCISNKKWKSLTQFNNKQNVDS